LLADSNQIGSSLEFISEELFSGNSPEGSRRHVPEESKKAKRQTRQREKLFAA
jgi:hypothetical protein